MHYEHHLRALLLALGLMWGQQKVLDLTEAPKEQAKWKIIATSIGGAMGSFTQTANKPVVIRLSRVLRRGKNLYFTIEIKNDCDVSLEVPVSLSSSRFDTGAEVIRFKELLVNFGTFQEKDSSFITSLGIKPVMLFGTKAVPSTIQVLPPGETLEIRLKTEIRANFSDDSRMTRVRISGSEVELTRTAAGYSEVGAIIPALFAMSNPSSTKKTK
jgi:hypothetical protein